MRRLSILKICVKLLLTIFIIPFLPHLVLSQDLNTADDLKKISIIGAHPFNWMDNNRGMWQQIFNTYKIEFLDRNTCLNDVNYLNETDSWHLNFVNTFGIPSSSYFTLHPIDMPGWSFAENYYNLLPENEKWIDIYGQIIQDPFEGGAAKDKDNYIIKLEANRPIMSLNNPYWLDYNKKSIEYAILEKDIDAINYDLININPITFFGCDYSLWCIDAFKNYLLDRYSYSYLISIGIDTTITSIKNYLINHPGNFYSNDQIVVDYYKFGFHTLIQFVEDLKTISHNCGEQKGKFAPFYGNLHIGHPHPNTLLYRVESMLLSNIVDIVQVETIPACPPERTMIINKIGQAMANYQKPVWSLHQPYYGYSFEPSLDLTKTFVGLNKLYLAEAYATGVIPEIDLGGWPGIQNHSGLFIENGSIPDELEKYVAFIKNNEDYFLNSIPRSNIGIVFSVPTFLWRNCWEYWNRGVDWQRQCFLGYARALEEMHLPYDVLIFDHPEFCNYSDVFNNLSKYDYLIFPYIDCVSNEQYQALVNYILNGGHLIGVGELNYLAKRNEDFELSVGYGFENLINNPGGGSISLIDDDKVRNFYNNHDNLSELKHPFGDYKPFINTNAPVEVAINTLENNNNLLIHIINYDYTFENNYFDIKDSINFSIGINDIQRLKYISPDENEEIELSFSTVNDSSFFTIKNLKTWGIVVVDTVEYYPPIANFSADTTIGCNPFTVQFYDSSTGNISSWSWDFGDELTSNQQNPIHTYEKSDTFTVSLTVSGLGGTDTKIKNDYIIVHEPAPIAHFGADSTYGIRPLTVQFSDSSTGLISNWLWDFGDDSTSNEQNPKHTYLTSDIFTVSLTVTGPGGSNTKTRENYIIVSEPTDVSNLNNSIPLEYNIFPNYPNPFNPSTYIRFSIPKASNVKITIYNINGRLIETIYNNKTQPGYYNIYWEASNYSTGTYFIKFNSDTYQKIIKCLLLK